MKASKRCTQNNQAAFSQLRWKWQASRPDRTETFKDAKGLWGFKCWNYGAKMQAEALGSYCENFDYA